MAAVRSSGPRRPETLLQLSGEPVFLLGPTGRFLYVNPAWEELTGIPASTVLGRNDESTIQAPHHSEVLDCFHPPVEAMDGVAVSTIGRVQCLDGPRHWRRLEFWPHHDRDGRVLFILGLVRPMDEASLAPESPGARLRAELWKLREAFEQRLGTDSLIGFGPAHRRLIDQIEAAAVAKVPVLIVGPPGSGKRQVAWTIHSRAGRSDAPFVVIDCAALPAEVIDRELFGSPGARSKGPARLKIDHGSLVLRDVLELPRDLQARLAEALTLPDSPQVRVLALTGGDPEDALREDRLRSDLFYSLSTLVIRLLPLQQRLEELPVLAQHFLDRANRRTGIRRLGFRPEAIETLVQYDWPGNLSELVRVVDFAHQRATTEMIGPEHLPPDIQGHLGSAYLPPAQSQEQFPLDAMLERLERRLIEQALRSARGNKSLAAKMLHISRARLHRRVQELGLAGEPEDESISLSARGDADRD
ncbi:sigma 54-interacting transcriptional regulator [Tautonia rosea]|uniref:sigma 54-interacting transcriptional regulator n=1 Tax=Tautonia rosea TaxID=2728037 RepID=UPI00147380C0|nr:sigma 54-interacting transcriptional regulator [Tautonia rosea]